MRSLRALCPGPWTIFSLSLFFVLVLLALGHIPTRSGICISCATFVIRWLSLTPFIVAGQTITSHLYLCSALFYRELIDIGLYNFSLFFSSFFLLLSPVSSPTFPSFVIDVLQDEGLIFRVLLSSGLCPGHWIGMPLDIALRVSMLTSAVLGL
jgi:hypothetical protein